MTGQTMAISKPNNITIDDITIAIMIINDLNIKPINLAKVLSKNALSFCSKLAVGGAYDVSCFQGSNSVLINNGTENSASMDLGLSKILLYEPIQPWLYHQENKSKIAISIF